MMKLIYLYLYFSSIYDYESLLLTSSILLTFINVQHRGPRTTQWI